ncbi:MAG TPA: peptidoglycan-binding protein, partial [Devosia sp.]|nr:peptidoglycan-binding protein [Devosia sp.]
IKAGLSAVYDAARPGTRAFADAQKLYYFYGARGFEPLWLTEDESGNVAFSPDAQKIISVFEQSRFEGLRPSDYLTDNLDLDSDSDDPAQMAALETAFSSAVTRYAQHAANGRINPRDVSRSIDIEQRNIDSASFLVELASSNAPDELLLSLSPTHREFLALKDALARNLAGEREKPIVIADGKLLKPGMSDARVPALRKRLGLEPLEGTNYYGEELAEAIKSFQHNMGLVVDGVTGPATIAALNGGTEATAEDIVANMERWRWMPRDLGDFYVFVNIPEFRLAVMRGDEVTHSTRVVVGKPQFKTPVFSDEIEHVVVNPFWNVPASIARNEIGPALARNPGYLAANNMELLSGGQVINASAVDWSSTSINAFRIRQRPGSNNALGSVKFLFPNKHAVYLHDTPSRSLFARSTRAYSHGCVRVQNPMEFAEALLANEPVLSRAYLQAQRGPRERWNNLDTHVPVHLAYFTLRVDEDGNIRGYGDIYGHNERLKALLAN